MSVAASKSTLLSPGLLQKINSHFYAYSSTPFCFAELSHRSTTYDELNTLAHSLLAQFFAVSDTHRVVLLPTGAFIPSLHYNTVITPDMKVCILRTGALSKGSYEEFLRICPSAQHLTHRQFSQIAIAHPHLQYMVLYHRYDDGKLHDFEFGGNVTSVVDMSYEISPLQSNKSDIICYRSSCGLSIPGFDIVLLRKQLLENLVENSHCPDMMNYSLMLKMKSVVNTPSPFCTLILSEVLKEALKHHCQISEQIEQNKQTIIQYLKEKYEIDITTDPRTPFICLERKVLEGKGIKLNEQSEWFESEDDGEVYFFIQRVNSDPEKFFSP